MPVTLAIDIGGSGIKMMKINDRDKPIGERIKKPTPRPATPLAVVKCIKSMLPEQGKFDRVSVGFPGVIHEGVIKTAPNLDGDWSDFNLLKALSKITKKPIKIANDADIQGYGVVSGKGLEMVITLGTGMGAALFIDGVLVPNLELGHHPFKGKKTYEDLLGKRALEKNGSKKWNNHLHEAISLMRQIFNFDRLYIGGGNAEKITFKPGPDVILAHNIAGLLGGLKLWK
ncbi:MAG: ROK family protein [Myxococcaceae bacterium]